MWSSRDVDIRASGLQLQIAAHRDSGAHNAVHRQRISFKGVEMKEALQLLDAAIRFRAGTHQPEAERLLGFRATTALEQGLAELVKRWRAERELTAVSPRQGAAS
jgi:hypothetical protein